MYQALMVIHVLIALAIVGLVMLQQGRGADAGAGFGGASSSVFGARGAASFLSRTTGILATIFFLSSLTLAYLAGNRDNEQVDIMDVPEMGGAIQPDLPAVADEPAVNGSENGLDLPAVNEPVESAKSADEPAEANIPSPVTEEMSPEMTEQPAEAAPAQESNPDGDNPEIGSEM